MPAEAVENPRTVRWIERMPLQDVLGAVIDGVILQDAAGTVMYANPEAERILGVTVEQLQNPESDELVLRITTPEGDAIPESEYPFLRVGETLKPLYGLEYGVSRPHGGRLIVSANVAPLLDENGAFVGAVTSFRDVSRRFQLERDLRRSNAELEQFAYVASHDLQEPLRMVSSYVQLLARRYKDQLDADGEEFIAFAVDGAQRMQRLINDLLAFSRVNAQGHRFAPTNLEVVLQRVIRMLQPHIESSGAVIEHETLPTVSADEGQCEQLFRNLVGNAIKYRREGVPPRIEITCEEQPTQWLFTVRDNGIGVASEHHERVFLIFQRLHGREEYSGTGIGLAICRRIVERHQGRLWLESSPGEGSSFSFTLPKGVPVENA